MAWYEIPNTNAVSIYSALLFGVLTIIFVFRLWLKATCGKFESKVRLDGKTVLITGANSGIGKETARDLAKRGARVIMACRTMETAHKARDEIIKETKNKNCVVYPLDLSSFKSVRECAAEIVANEERLDILIHNAGYANYIWRGVSPDGIEITMATNHYGPFLLTHLLIDLMKKTAKKNPCRIVVVASKTHTLSYMDPCNEKHLNPVGHFPPSDLYGNSKFANILFTFELARRLKHKNITANCLHPGVVDTGIFRNIPFPISTIFNLFASLFFRSIEEGIQTTLFVAMAEELEGVTGRYFRNCKYGTPRSDVMNVDWQKAMWDASVRLVQLKDDDPKI